MILYAYVDVLCVCIVGHGYGYTTVLYRAYFVTPSLLYEILNFINSSPFRLLAMEISYPFIPCDYSLRMLPLSEVVSVIFQDCNASCPIHIDTIRGNIQIQFRNFLTEYSTDFTVMHKRAYTHTHTHTHNVFDTNKC